MDVPSSLFTKAPDTTIQAVLFDYGLVLTGPAHPPAWERMKDLLGAGEAPFHAAYWRYRQDYDSGALSGRDYWRQIATDLAPPMAAISAVGESAHQDDLIGALIEADTDLWTQPNQPMIDWAASLQARNVFTGILSNLGDAMEAGVRQRCPWLDAFNHLTFSHHLGTTKPDPAIYTFAASGLGVQPEEILFIDDREDNVAGAQATGMQAIRYLDHDSFIASMRSAGFGALLL